MKATLVKGGTRAPATATDAGVDAEAATEQTKNHKKTNECNETVLRAMQKPNKVRKRKKIYIPLVKKKKNLNKLTRIQNE